ncbi:MAG: FGGY family carbohydrate kinase [Desulfotignum sp.]|nr:FGGY family carbohydrate kinase [Desulfotignum sp.]
MTSYLGAVDQGTTSTRFIIFDKDGGIVAVSRMEHDQICEKPGWVAHDPARIRDNTFTVIAKGPGKGRPQRQGPGRCRGHQPERDRDGLGQAHGTTAVSCRCMAVRPQ